MQIPDNIAKTAIILADEYFDLAGLSIYCKLGKSTLRDHIRRDGLPHFKVRGKILVKRSEFDQWLARFRQNKDQDIRAIANEAIGQLRRRSKVQKIEIKRK